MNRLIHIFGALLSMTLFVGFPVSAQTMEDVVVFIVCDRPDGRQEYGSGIIVSHDGKVVTALHVVEGNDNCRGSIGYRDEGNAKPLLPQPIPQLNVDVAVMRFTDQRQSYDYLGYCEVLDWMKWRPILVAGFPNKTESGAISVRQGILSTVSPTSEGLLETDSLVAKGMSGGPVLSSNRAGIIGIIVGAKPQREGGIAYEAILPTSYFAVALGLIKAERECYHRVRQIELSPENSTWTAGSAAVMTGVNSEEAVCYLSSVSGVFNSSNDKISVEVEEGEYTIIGSQSEGGDLEATVSCYWIE
ncbi:MAG: serine protease [Pseudomonadota bacterium]